VFNGINQRMLDNTVVTRHDDVICQVDALPLSVRFLSLKYGE
jgi:hypothetical protein